MDIRVGTSGYDYPDWAGILYPNDLPRDEYIKVYGQAFSTLELNFSYYRMPSAHNLETMIFRANRSMDFSIKANKALTHEVKDWKADTKKYLAGIEPLINFHRLATILFEFPSSFHYVPDNRIYLANLLDEFKSLPVVVEFRNKDWFTERVYEGLAKRNVSLCYMDLPSSALKQEIKMPVNQEIVYWRLHGRNDTNWWNGDNVSRYDYLYSHDELAEVANQLHETGIKTKMVRVYFNNHAKGNAVQNAKEMGELLNLGNIS
jgi:uncharacterized protein YecE (DUF72 family)